jgi:hypothetical protein
VATKGGKEAQQQFAAYIEEGKLLEYFSAHWIILMFCDQKGHLVRLQPSLLKRDYFRK